MLTAVIVRQGGGSAPDTHRTQKRWEEEYFYCSFPVQPGYGATFNLLSLPRRQHRLIIYNLFIQTCLNDEPFHPKFFGAFKSLLTSRILQEYITEHC